jgi:hypothetical protein
MEVECSPETLVPAYKTGLYSDQGVCYVNNNHYENFEKTYREMLIVNINGEESRNKERKEKKR